MQGFYVSVSNLTKAFVEVWLDSITPGADPAIHYQPREAMGIKLYTAQIIKIKITAPPEQTGTLSICELEVFGGKYF